MIGRSSKLRRRKFLGVLAAGGACGSAMVYRDRASGWRFFTEEEARTVDAICEQLIPADADPGAHEAGVVNYIDIQLTKHFKRYSNAYRRGINEVDQLGRYRFGAVSRIYPQIGNSRS